LSYFRIFYLTTQNIPTYGEEVLTFISSRDRCSHFYQLYCQLRRTAQPYASKTGSVLKFHEIFLKYFKDKYFIVHL